MRKPMEMSFIVLKLTGIDRKLLTMSLGVHKSIDNEHALMDELIKVQASKQRDRLNSWYLLYVIFALVTYISSSLDIGEMSILSLMLLGLLIACQRSLNILMINREVSVALTQVLMDSHAHNEDSRNRLGRVYRHKGAIGVEDVIAIDELRLINRDLH